MSNKNQPHRRMNCPLNVSTCGEERKQFWLTIVRWIGLSMLLCSGCQAGKPAAPPPSAVVPADGPVLSNGTALPKKASLNVRLVGQETELWCWAASTEMIVEFLDPAQDVKQCDEASNQDPPKLCCGATMEDGCINGGWPDFGRYKFNATRTSSQALPWDTICEQIARKKAPIAFSWKWTGGGGHMMVIVGYSLVGDQKYLTVYDPLPPTEGGAAGGHLISAMTYEQYVQSDDHTHWDDFYDIKKQP
jgi:hypothetical protein